jgi:hypothetical protein
VLLNIISDVNVEGQFDERMERVVVIGTAMEPVEAIAGREAVVNNWHQMRGPVSLLSLQIE